MNTVEGKGNELDYTLELLKVLLVCTKTYFVMKSGVPVSFTNSPEEKVSTMCVKDKRMSHMVHEKKHVYT